MFIIYQPMEDEEEDTWVAANAGKLEFFSREFLNSYFLLLYNDKTFIKNT